MAGRGSLSGRMDFAVLVRKGVADCAEYGVEGSGNGWRKGEALEVGKQSVSVVKILHTFYLNDSDAGRTIMLDSLFGNSN